MMKFHERRFCVHPFFHRLFFHHHRHRIRMTVNANKCATDWESLTRKLTLTKLVFVF